MPELVGSSLLTVDSKRKSFNREPKTVNSKSFGFTLIELLVVIAVIGILATFVVASFASAQAKGRDARRKSDLDAVMKALELWKGDSAGGTYYPTCAGSTAAAPNCPVTSGGSSNFSATPNPPGHIINYIKTVPTDPKVQVSGTCEPALNHGLRYCYYPTGCASVSGSYQCTGYTFQSCLENANDQSATADATQCGDGTGGRLYSLQNP